MPQFALRLSEPESVSAKVAARSFYWTGAGRRGSFVSTYGPRLGGMGPVREQNVEFVRLAAAVVAADRTAPRRIGRTNWSRRAIEITVPMFFPSRWDVVAGELEALLGFLSGDDWTLKFTKSPGRKEDVAEAVEGEIERVVLMSGGADSAIGVLRSLSELGGKGHILVSHVGATNFAPVQRDLASAASRLQPGHQQSHVQVRLSRRAKRADGRNFVNEYSTRARSLLFVSLGLAMASVHEVPLWVPENGFASLNPPLGADQRGSVSTRTTHPTFLRGLEAVLRKVGAHAGIENPFERLTKGEMFVWTKQLVGKRKAEAFLKSTHSCAHTGHRSRPLQLSLRYQCGVCFGCLVRRAAFEAAGLDDGSDYLNELAPRTGLTEYLADKSMEGAMSEFVDRGVRPATIASMGLPLDHPPSEAVQLCGRAIEELRKIVE